MNRRQFLKTLFAAAVGSTLELESKVDQLLATTNHLDDRDFIAYVTYTFNIYVCNPASCAIITGITGPDE